MAKHNKEEVEILSGKATIYTYAYGVWQFRLWLTTDNKYVRVIAELASHKSIQTTQRYIDINDNLCRNAVELA